MLCCTSWSVRPQICREMRKWNLPITGPSPTAAERETPESGSQVRTESERSKSSWMCILGLYEQNESVSHSSVLLTPQPPSHGTKNWAPCFYSHGIYDASVLNFPCRSIQTSPTSFSRFNYRLSHTWYGFYKSHFSFFSGQDIAKFL